MYELTEEMKFFLQRHAFINANMYLCGLFLLISANFSLNEFLCLLQGEKEKRKGKKKMQPYLQTHANI